MATLKDKVQAGVDKAFAKVDSLLIDAVFTTKTVTDYSLDLEATVETPGVVTTKRVLKIEKIHRSSDGPIKIEQLFFKADGKDYTVYDSVAYGGRSYKIVTAVDDGYTVTVEVQRV